jgi:hypothetical protein
MTPRHWLDCDVAIGPGNSGICSALSGSWSLELRRSRPPCWCLECSGLFDSSITRSLSGTAAALSKTADRPARGRGELPAVLTATTDTSRETCREPTDCIPHGNSSWLRQEAILLWRCLFASRIKIWWIVGLTLPPTVEGGSPLVVVGDPSKLTDPIDVVGLINFLNRNDITDPLVSP